MALSQLMFEKYKWILSATGKRGMRLRYRGFEKCIWYMVLVVDLSSICDIHCRILQSDQDKTEPMFRLENFKIASK
jgi:hypothetical protein